jgi:MATE family multidrug resistance protein
MNQKTLSMLRSLMLISGPAMVISISRTMMQFVDFLFVSYLGTEAIAAITPAGMMTWILIGTGMGWVSIVGTFAAQSVGAGEPREATRYLWQSVYASIVIGCFAMLMIPFVATVMKYLGHAPQVYAYEVMYSEVVLLSAIPSLAAFAIQCFMISANAAVPAMYAALIANLVNAVFAYGLIYGKLGMPELGFVGAAWSTVLASVVQLVCSVIFLCKGSLAKEFRFMDREAMRWSKEPFMRFLKLGFPVGVTWTADVLAWSVFVNFLVGGFGTVALAASNIVLQFLHLAFMPAMGMGQALLSLVGQAIGDKKPQDAIAYTNLSTMLCMFWMGSIGLIVFFAGGKIASAVNSDSTVIATAAEIFKVAAWFQLFDAVAITSSFALRAAGDTRFPAVVSLVGNWLVFVGGGYVMARYFPEFGATGPWIAGTILIMLLGLVFRWRFIKGTWTKIDIFEQA